MRINFCDTETTDLIIDGPDGRKIYPQIIQYAFVTWEDGKLVNLHARLVQPTVPVQPGAAKANGYTPEYWAANGATPLNEQDIAAFHTLMNGQFIGGQNIMGFDLPVIAAECNRLGFAAPKHDYHVIETMSFGLVLQALGLVKSSSLKPVAEFLNLKEQLPVFGYPDRQRPHDAVFDAACSAQLFSEMLVRTADGFAQYAGLSAAHVTGHVDANGQPI
jgi:DNA polymerase III epsilon subunit-like protein